MPKFYEIVEKNRRKYYLFTWKNFFQRNMKDKKFLLTIWIGTHWSFAEGHIKSYAAEQGEGSSKIVFEKWGGGR